MPRVANIDVLAFRRLVCQQKPGAVEHLMEHLSGEKRHKLAGTEVSLRNAAGSEPRPAAGSWKPNELVERWRPNRPSSPTQAARRALIGPGGFPSLPSSLFSPSSTFPDDEDDDDWRRLTL